MELIFLSILFAPFLLVIAMNMITVIAQVVKAVCTDAVSVIKDRASYLKSL